MALAMAVLMPKQSARLAATLNSPPLTWILQSVALRKGMMPGSRRWTSAPSERKSRSASLRIFNAVILFPFPGSLFSGSRRLADIGDDLIGGPFIAWIKTQHLAVRANQRGGKRVSDRAVRRLGDADIEILRQFLQLRPGG